MNKMDKAKEILYRHTKSANCRSDLIKNPFLEQAVLNAINEALRIHDVVGRSERLILKLIAPNGDALLSVFEFEKQKSMILTDDDIRIAAQQWVSLTDAPNPNATSFAAGAKFVLQKLQQCNVVRSVCLHLDTYVDEDNFIRCSACDRITDA